MRSSRSVILGLHSRKLELPGTSSEIILLDSVDSILKAIDKVEPDIIVHTAGMTSVEECESKPDLAHHVNVELAANLSKACAERKVTQVHISTDHLFSGHKQFVDEEEPVEPINVYGKTKAEAERQVSEINAEALVVRTNFYGWGPSYRHSFSDIVIDTLRTGRELTLFNDVHYTPILTETLAKTVHQLVERRVCGICNVSGNDRLSKHDFGCRVAKKFGLDSSLIKEGRMSERAGLVQRPLDMSLSNEKLREVYGLDVGGVDQHINRLFELEQSGEAAEIRKL